MSNIYLVLFSILLNIESDYLFSFINSYALSVIVVLTILVSFLSFYILGFSPTSLPVLFLVSISVFLCGRYFYVVIGGDLDIFNISFFTYYSLVDADKLRLTSYILIMILFFTQGAIITKKDRYVSFDENYYHLGKKTENLIFLVGIVIASIYLFSSFSQLITSLSSGYLSLYSEQSQGFSGSNLNRTFFFVFLGLCFLFSLNRLKKIFIIVIFISALSSLISGQRGGAVTVFLFLVWVYGLENKISWFKSLIFMVIIFLVLQSLSLLSSREIETSSNILAVVKDFLYKQGISLMVFDASTKLDSYPMLPFFQSFIPGVSTISSFFVSLNSADVSYAGFLANHLNPTAYENGQGLGWSLPSYFYIWSSGNLLLYCIYSFLFGYIIGLFNARVKEYKFYLGLMACLTTSLLFLPRNQLSTVVPLAIYFYVIYIFIINVDIKLKN